MEGLTTTDPTEAYTKELVMEHAREVILLADSSKAHKISFTRAGRLEKVRVLITDSLFDRKLCEGTAQAGYGSSARLTRKSEVRSQKSS